MLLAEAFECVDVGRRFFDHDPLLVVCGFNSSKTRAGMQNCAKYQPIRLCLSGPRGAARGHGRARRAARVAAPAGVARGGSVARGVLERVDRGRRRPSVDAPQHRQDECRQPAERADNAATGQPPRHARNAMSSSRIGWAFGPSFLRGGFSPRRGTDSIPSRRRGSGCRGR